MKSERIAGYSVWSASDRTLGVEVRFAGRGPAPRRPADRLLALLDGGAPRGVAWARQTHSARVLRVGVAERGGPSGEGDALVTPGDDLALAVFTADCLPVLVAAPGAVAAVHAGWRGLVAGVIPSAVAAMDAPPGTLRAWIGPAIGPCCYEVGEDVAAAVVAKSSPSVRSEGKRGRPHLDLAAAVRHQLRAHGVAESAITQIDHCTRCEPDELWSYRRDGEGTGSNVSYIWRRRRDRS